MIPVAIFALVFYGLYSALFRSSDPFHLWLLAGTALVLATSVVMATAGVGVAACFVVVALAPVVTVVGYELLGHRHMEDMVQRL